MSDRIKKEPPTKTDCPTCKGEGTVWKRIRCHGTSKASAYRRAGRCASWAKPGHVLCQQHVRMLERIRANGLKATSQ